MMHASPYRVIPFCRPAPYLHATVKQASFCVECNIESNSLDGCAHCCHLQETNHPNLHPMHPLSLRAHLPPERCDGIGIQYAACGRTSRICDDVIVLLALCVIVDVHSDRPFPARFLVLRDQGVLHCVQTRRDTTAGGCRPQSTRTFSSAPYEFHSLIHTFPPTTHTLSRSPSQLPLHIRTHTHRHLYDVERGQTF